VGGFFEKKKKKKAAKTGLEWRHWMYSSIETQYNNFYGNPKTFQVVMWCGVVGAMKSISESAGAWTCEWKNRKIL